MKRVLLGMAISLVACAGVTDAATAKVKTTAKVDIKNVWTINGTNATFDSMAVSKNKHCLRDSIVGLDAMRFYFGGTPVTPGTPEGSDGFTDLPHSQDFPPKRLGPGHFLLVVPANQPFPSTNPNGTNGGTYTLSNWWQGIGYSNYGTSDHSFVNYSGWAYGGGALIGDLQPGGFGGGFMSGRSREKVKYKKAGTTHVVICEAADSPFDMRDPNGASGMYAPWIPAFPYKTGFPIPSSLNWWLGTWS